MGVEHGVEVCAVGAAGQRRRAGAAGGRSGGPGRATRTSRTSDGDAEADDGRADERRDEGVEVDRWVLRAGVDAARGRRAARV